MYGSRLEIMYSPAVWDNLFSLQGNLTFFSYSLAGQSTSKYFINYIIVHTILSIDYRHTKQNEQSSE